MYVFFIISVFFLNSATSFHLTVLHTNDVHARYEEMNKYGGLCSDPDGKCYGGMARLKTKVDEIRSMYPNSLLLDAGDQYQGTLWFTQHGGAIVRTYMNLLGYDAMVWLYYRITFIIYFQQKFNALVFQLSTELATKYPLRANFFLLVYSYCIHDHPFYMLC